MKNALRILAWIFGATVLFGQTPGAFGHAVELLRGDWIAAGGKGQDLAKGGFLFHPEVQGKVLTRRSWAEYPATKDHPKFRHDDVMLIYDQAGTQPLRAFYLDNEGHAIDYTVDVTDDTVTFTSSAAPGEPHYRMTYRRIEASKLMGKFEAAPATAPAAFATMLEWTAERAQ